MTRRQHVAAGIGPSVAGGDLAAATKSAHESCAKGFRGLAKTKDGVASPMTQIERYIFRIAFGAFMACLVGLTAVIWITQALRELDLLTGKGQTFVVFMIATGLSLPALIAIIAPLAVFIAGIYTLNRLNNDSELIVMNAAGMAPGRLMRPFLLLSGGVSIVVAVMTLWLIPASFNQLRDLITQIRADFVTTLVREGQFTRLESGVTFSFRERSGEALLGIFMQDRRDPESTIVYIAEAGQVASVDENSYLVLEQGSIHRQTTNARDSSIVAFDRYAVDLSSFMTASGPVQYKPRERSTDQLLFPDREDPYYIALEGRFRSELHDRLTAWLYPLAMMGIAFVALGNARTTRQGRGVAIAGAIVAVVVFRIGGFAASSALRGSPGAVVAVWGVPILTILACWGMIFHGSRIEPVLSRIRKAGNPFLRRRTATGAA
jgi:lipopolysaccharide export system permease protein